MNYNHKAEHVLSKAVLDSFSYVDHWYFNIQAELIKNVFNNRRPTLLITDSMNLMTEQPKLKDRDSQVFVEWWGKAAALFMSEVIIHSSAVVDYGHHFDDYSPRGKCFNSM